MTVVHVSAPSQSATLTESMTFNGRLRPSSLPPPPPLCLHQHVCLTMQCTHAI